jgi:Fe-S cluster assembly iron-binding protein IscA
MVEIGAKAAQALRDKLLETLFKEGIGFRIYATEAQDGSAAFAMRLDSIEEGDELLAIDGINVFLDLASAAKLSARSIDYMDEPQRAFVLI